MEPNSKSRELRACDPHPLDALSSRAGSSTGMERGTQAGTSSAAGAGAGGGGVDFGVLLEKAKKLDALKKKQEEVDAEINKIHKKIRDSPEMSDRSVQRILTKLRSLYSHAKEQAENEISALNDFNEMLDNFFQSRPSTAQRKKIEVGEQERKRIKSDTDMPQFSAASTSNQLDQAAILKGAQVAARVKSDDEKDEWISVKVTHFDKETKEYELLNKVPGDDEESTQKYERKYKVHMNYIIPFPKRRYPSRAPDFGLGQQVLAVYPGTTALCRATVASHHKFHFQFLGQLHGCAAEPILIIDLLLRFCKKWTCFFNPNLPIAPVSLCNLCPLNGVKLHARRQKCPLQFYPCFLKVFAYSPLI